MYAQGDIRGRLLGEQGDPTQGLHSGHLRQGPEEEDQEDSWSAYNVSQSAPI